MILSDYFKVYPAWDHHIKPETVLNDISFCFTMKGWPGLYFKTKQPTDNIVGLDCFQFSFDTDNGIYINDGDMRFNQFMGEQITDSGADAVGFIREYLIEKGLTNLIV